MGRAAERGPSHPKHCLLLVIVLRPATVPLQHLNSSYSFGAPFSVINQANPAYNGISESQPPQLLPPIPEGMWTLPRSPPLPSASVLDHLGVREPRRGLPRDGLLLLGQPAVAVLRRPLHRPHARLPRPVPLGHDDHALWRARLGHLAVRDVHCHRGGLPGEEALLLS